MSKIFYLFQFLFCCEILHSQGLYGFIQAPENFSKNDIANSYFNTETKEVHINFQDGYKITRCRYDSLFSLKDSFSFRSNQLSLSAKENNKITFVAPLVTQAGNFEIYADNDDIQIRKIDFQQQKDSLCFTIKFDKKKGEKILSILPDKNDLKILTFLDNGKLNVYRWWPDRPLESITINLPESNFTKEEEKIYTKDCRIRFKKLKPLRASRINSINTFPAENQVYYETNKICILLTIPFNIGICVTSIDLVSGTFNIKNYFLNDLRVNAGENNNLIKNVTASLFDSVLIIKNASPREFEYYFFNVATSKFIRKYTVPVKDSVAALVHSSVTQKGTYSSKEGEKTLKDKSSYRLQHLSLTDYSEDSVTFALFSIVETEGIEGTLLSMATLPFGYLAGIYIGNLQLIPYLTIKRNVLIYAYSRFNKQNLEASSNRNVISNLDNVLDEVRVKTLGKNSSFFIQKDRNAFVGIFNDARSGFDVLKFNAN
ncbi:MAG: hypothetical protein HZB42_06485 [Sphingobacteriales bacterium]|nr:hypothetical protein [Sphingobacteriales bacterium]